MVVSIVLYITNRHPKDICRSFAHELIHHHQNERGDLDMGNATSPTYAQDDPHMRKMEMEAYLKGNMLFRDWEDGYKSRHKDIFYEITIPIKNLDTIRLAVTNVNQSVV